MTSGATVRPATHPADQSPVGPLALWIGVLGGPTLVLVNLEILYLLTPAGCPHRTWLLHAAALVGGLLVAATLARAARSWRRVRDREADDGDDGASRARFLAGLGLLTSSVSLVAALAMWIPVFLLNPCLPAG